MTTAVTQIQSTPHLGKNDEVMWYDITARKNGLPYLLASVLIHNEGTFLPNVVEGKYWADLFADALRLKRENDKLRQELAGQGWQEMSTVDLYDHEKQPPIVMLYSREFGIQLGRAVRFKDGAISAHAAGFSGYWNITHWQPLPAPPLCATQGNSLPAEVRA
jgi:hypothetical protein